MSNKISKTYNRKIKGLLISASLLLTALSVSGCSNFTRFDFPLFGLDKEEEVNTTSSVRRSSEYGDVNRVYPPLNHREREAASRSGYYSSIYGERRYESTDHDHSHKERDSSPNNKRNDGYYSKDRNQDVRSDNGYEKSYNSHIVKPGENLYRIALRNKVKVAELKEANGLTGNIIHVGQELIIPVSDNVYRDYERRRPYQTSRKTIRRSYRGAGSYGGRMYDVPRNSGVRNRPIPNQRYARLGSYPEQRFNRRPKRDVRKPRRNVRRRHNSGGVRRHSVTRPPKVLNRNRDEEPVQRNNDRVEEPVKPQKQASLPRKSEQIQSKPAQEEVNNRIIMPRTSGRFRWPVRGRIISKFGIKRNGARNDGINLSVPFGTEVRAAEAGVVAYAGNELKGYGNLVLIRHKDKWVTAYAHNSKILVRRGQRVRRGQVIAKAGKSGSVSQPQVHFELRKGDKPVDPLKFM